MAELTINEYRSRLHILSQKADADGRHKVSEFTLHLLKQENPDLKILDAIFKYYDSITDSDTVVYDYLLDNKASVEWFYFAGFLSDQRGNVSDYFSILKECFEAGIQIDKLYQFEKQSDNIEKFDELVKKEIADNSFEKKERPNMESSQKEIIQDEYIQHLIEENNILNKRLDKTLNELKTVRTEQKDMLEKTASDKHVLMNYKLDNEQLRKEVEKLRLSVEITTKKNTMQSSMIDQLSSINDTLTDENEAMKHNAEELSKKYQEVLQESAMHTDIINNLNVQISQLQSQLRETSMMRNMQGPILESVIEQQPEYGRDFDVENETFESDLNEQKSEPEVPPETEPETLDYDPSDLIEIKNNKNEVKKHSNFFIDFIARHFEKKFANKSIAEQDNLIFIKLMENDYEQDTVRAVKSAMKNNQELSRVDLYRLVTGRKSDNEICSFCTAVSA